MSIRTKLIILFLASVLIPVFYIGVVSYVTAFDTVERSALTSIHDVAELKEAKLYVYLDTFKTRIRDFASDGFIREQLAAIEAGRDVESHRRRLARHLVENKKSLDERILSLDLVDMGGMTVASTDGDRVGVSMADAPLFQRGLVRPAIGTVRLLGGGIVELPLATPVREIARRRSVIGVLVARFDSSGFNDVLTGKAILDLGAKSQRLDMGSTVETSIVDMEGRAIFSTSSAEGVSCRDRLRSPPVRGCIESDEEYVGRWMDCRGEPVVGASMCLAIGDARWTLVVKQNEAEALAYMASYSSLVLIIGAVILVIVVVTAVSISQSISRPIQRLREGTALIANGRFEHRVAIPGSDEIAQLSRDFDAMADKLLRTTASRDQLERAEKEMRSLSMFPIFNPNIVAKADAAGNFIYLNSYVRAFMDEHGLTYPKEAFPPETASMVAKAVEEGTTLKGVEFTCCDHIFTYEFSPFMEERTVYIYGRDITELKRREEDLRRANQMKSDFLANMSHELRTPLNSIIGFSEILYDETFGSVNEKQKDYLKDVLSSGRHLLSLINDILDISKIEAGKLELQLSTFPLADLVRDSLSMIKERAFKHGIRLEADVADDVGEMEGDERKVKQILFNLLSNAAKFTPDGGRIGVRARMSGREIEVAVWDTGIGIIQDDQRRIFEEFTQLENPFTKKTEGTGLGLALTKKLVELHGGTIRVISEGEGTGTTFVFTLPRTQ